MQSDLKIRKIKAEDNPFVAKIIRDSLEEYNEAKPGTVYTDPTTDEIFETFDSTPKSAYFIAELKGEVIGGSGVFPTEGLPQAYAELAKIYLSAKSRGKGIGKILMDECIAYSKAEGYTHLYLESFPSLKEAIHLYEKVGFKRVDERLGNSGHFACDVWMVLELALVSEEQT